MKSAGILSRALSVLILVICGSTAAMAQLAKPTGEVILTVTGKIKHTNQPGKAEFDRAMLEALGISTIETTHSWGDGVTRFEGVTASKVLDAVGASGGKLRAAAINDYAIDLDVGELRKYPVMLALRQNGADLSRRDRGPIWIVYPRDAFPEFKDEKHNYKWIWQLKSIDVQ